MPIESENRQKRQDAIREILRRQPVARQAQIVAMLKEQGIRATQSSVSRDLRQLGIAKLGSGYAEPQSVAVAANNDHDLDLLSEFIRDVQTAGANLTVIQTAIGAAQRVAVYLDRSGWPEIVGTLSGDDTIFVATRNGTEQRKLVGKLNAHFIGQL